MKSDYLLQNSLGKARQGLGFTSSGGAEQLLTEGPLALSTCSEANSHAVSLGPAGAARPVTLWHVRAEDRYPAPTNMVLGLRALPPGKSLGLAVRRPVMMSSTSHDAGDELDARRPPAPIRTERQLPRISQLPFLLCRPACAGRQLSTEVGASEGRKRRTADRRGAQEPARSRRRAI